MKSAVKFSKDEGLHVAIVPRGMNGKLFALRKQDGGDMDLKDLIKAATGKDPEEAVVGSLAKADSELTKALAEVLKAACERIDSMGKEAKDAKAVVTAKDDELKVAKADIERAKSEVHVGYIKDPSLKPVLKADDLPAEWRERVAKLEKEATEASELRAMILRKAALEEATTTFKHVPGATPQVLADILLKADSGQAQDPKVLRAMFGTIEGAIAKAPGFKEIGSSASGSGNVNDRVKERAEELRKSDPKITEAQAMAAAYRENPGAYEAALAGRN